MSKMVNSDPEYYISTDSSYTKNNSGSYESRNFGFLYENLEQALIACTKIQSIYRGHKARDECSVEKFARLLREARRISAIEIQRHWRGNVSTIFTKTLT